MRLGGIAFKLGDVYGDFGGIMNKDIEILRQDDCVTNTVKLILCL
jgi:hypothetical protein